MRFVVVVVLLEMLRVRLAAQVRPKRRVRLNAGASRRKCVPNASAPKRRCVPNAGASRRKCVPNAGRLTASASQNAGASRRKCVLNAGRLRRKCVQTPVVLYKGRCGSPQGVLNARHPVCCLSVVGTQNAHNLISVSTDGHVCSWSLDMLSQPLESMELLYNKSKPVAVTCLDFPTGDVNNYLVGSEEGAVYMASRHGSKAGICEVFEGHQGPVTGIRGQR
uniref:Uncharacterized protein n=1 Tax=Knipowitschia caucasica TaxID=637954 RepID=A0AAV2K5V5_KNICA